MILTRRVSAALVAFGVWSWVIWLTFLKNIWADPRSFDDGPTAFLTVHLVLIVVSIAIGTAIGALGVRGWRASSRTATTASPPSTAPDPRVRG